MSFNLLLVDDEYSTRDHIIKRMEWDNLDIGRIEQAEDGYQAMELCKRFTPDILLTDVRMPRLNGIELSKELIGKFPELKVIFISGYADKQYLKSAIEIKAVRYIEKPISIKELSEIMKSTVEMLAHSKTEESKIKELRSIEVNVVKDYLAQLITSSGFTEELGLKYLDKFDCGKKEYGLSVAVATAPLCKTEEINFDLYAKAEIQNLYAMFGGSSSEMVCTVKDEAIITFILDKARSDYVTMYSLVNQICTFLQNRLLLVFDNISIGVGTFEKKWSELPKSYKFAKTAAQQCFFMGPNSICYFKKGLKKVFDFSQIDISEFIHCLKKENKNHVVFFLRNMINNIKKYQNTTKEKAIQCYYSMISKLAGLADNEGVEIFDEFADLNEIWVHLNKLNNIDQLSEFLLEGINKYYGAIKNNQFDNEIVGRIIRHVRKNYADPELSVTSISLETNLSYTYLCHLFKQVTGNTLHKYVHDFRMKKALEFINDPKYKVKDIARLVGYRNGNYFSLKFKKHTGLAPTEYREKNNEFD